MTQIYCIKQPDERLKWMIGFLPNDVSGIRNMEALICLCPLNNETYN